MYYDTMLPRSSLSTRAASSALASTDSTSGVSEASSSLNISAAAAAVAGAGVGGSNPGTQQQQQPAAPNSTLNTSAAEQTLPHQLGSDEPSSFSSFSMSHR